MAEQMGVEQAGLTPPLAPKLQESQRTEVSSQNLVESQFKPSIEVDNAGFKRVFYHTKSDSGQDISFSLRGVYELPTYPSVSTGIVDIGSQPLPGIFSDEEYANYQQQLH